MKLSQAAAGRRQVIPLSRGMWASVDQANLAPRCVVRGPLLAPHTAPTNKLVAANGQQASKA
eukprot:11495142-Prorocentrum_lima.AAC.1